MEVWLGLHSELSFVNFRNHLLSCWSLQYFVARSQISYRCCSFATYQCTSSGFSSLSLLNQYLETLQWSYCKHESLVYSHSFIYSTLEDLRQCWRYAKFLLILLMWRLLEWYLWFWAMPVPLVSSSSVSIAFAGLGVLEFSPGYGKCETSKIWLWLKETVGEFNLWLTNKTFAIYHLINCSKLK